VPGEPAATFGEGFVAVLFPAGVGGGLFAQKTSTLPVTNRLTV
jgi:hypothetical protein